VTVEIATRSFSPDFRAIRGIDHGADFGTVISQRPPRRMKSPADEITRSRAGARARTCARGRNHCLTNGTADSMLQTSAARVSRRISSIAILSIERIAFDGTGRQIFFSGAETFARGRKCRLCVPRSGIMRHLARCSMMASSIMLRGRLHGTPANRNSTQAEE